MICVFLPSISGTAEVGNLTAGGGGGRTFLIAASGYAYCFER